MKYLILFLFVICLWLNGRAQSLAVNTDGSTANSSALLDVKSTTKGLLIPRLTKAEKFAIITPANGLLIYQTGPDSAGFYYYQNSQWNWLADNQKADSSYWGLHGNSNTTPPTSNNAAPINYFTDTYLGTTDAKDVSMLAGGNELLRLQQFATGGRAGFSNRNPEYTLDVRITEIANETQIQGMRIIPKSLFDLFNNDNKNKGLVIGSNPANANESAVWNHGNNLNGAIRMGLDYFDSNIQPAFNITGWGQGIYQRNPKYMLDIHSLSQFAAANNPSTNKNGIRITYQNQGITNTIDNGLMMGVGINNNVYKSYIWNYADGQGSNTPDKAIYFGVGPDMDPLYIGKPTMELQDGKIIIGHITHPDFFFPSTLNIQTDYATSAAKNGISIMKNSNTQELSYMGTDVNDNLNIFKYNGGNIFMGNPIDYTMTINSNNQVGIKTFTPNADLEFGESWANNKIVLHNNFHGNLPNNLHDFYGFGVESGQLRYQVPRNTAAHVFYGGNSTGTSSNELMRITGDGFVGIGNNNPQAPLQFSSILTNRKIVITGDPVNNDHNFMGFGNATDGGLRYQVPYSNLDHVFYKGDNGGAGSTELMRLKGTGQLGVGIINPSFRLEVNGRMKIHSGGSNATSAGIWLSNNANTINTGFVGMESDNGIGFYGTGTPNGWGLVMNIATGNVGIGTSTPSQKLAVVGNILASGTITPSDERYKKNIKPLEDAVAKLQQLNPVTYHMNSQAFPEWNFDDARQYGLIAQEVEKVFPEMVKTIDTKGYKGVDYVKLIPVLIEAIKEQQKQIEYLKKTIQNK